MSGWTTVNWMPTEEAETLFITGEVDFGDDEPLSEEELREVMDEATVTTLEWEPTSTAD